MARGAVTVLFELALVFCGRIFTRLRPPPSARFSRINHRSRNRSSPLFSCQRPRQALPPATTLHLSTPRRQQGFPRAAETQAATRLGRLGLRRCGVLRLWLRSRNEMAPAGAGGGRDAPAGPAGRVGAGHEVRASPEMRPGSHDDWAATPQASLSHHLRRQTVLGWLLYVTRNLKDFCRARPARALKPRPDGVSGPSDRHQHPPNAPPGRPYSSRPPDNDGHAASS